MTKAHDCIAALERLTECVERLVQEVEWNLPHDRLEAVGREALGAVRDARKALVECFSEGRPKAFVYASEIIGGTSARREYALDSFSGKCPECGGDMARYGAYTDSSGVPRVVYMCEGDCALDTAVFAPAMSDKEDDGCQ